MKPLISNEKLPSEITQMMEISEGKDYMNILAISPITTLKANNGE